MTGIIIMLTTAFAIPTYLFMATVLGMGLSWWWGWSLGAALIFGLSLSCASTDVVATYLRGSRNRPTSSAISAIAAKIEARTIW